ncbi:MAG: hypothetical protein H7227_06815 [Actinobacteria bacterium]|nr:hypothetical protein [Actinomycetota bacterium]
MKTAIKRSIAYGALALFAVTISAPPALAAEKGYRYWGYFQAKPSATKWAEAQTGPSVVMADGSVEGWAFTFSGGSVTKAAAPAVLPNFNKICGGTKAVAQKKRVGVVIDFGNPVLAPKGETVQSIISTCVVLEKKAIGLDALAKVVKVRANAAGFVCGFNNYPKKECGVEIATPRSLIAKK